jgi:PEP-CTERM motif
MKKVLGILAVTASVAIASQAMAIPVAGIDFLGLPQNAHFEVTSIYEDNPTARATPKGTKLNGYGQINQINGVTNPGFCVPAPCDLVFKFSYTVGAIDPAAGTIDFVDGSVDVFRVAGAQRNFFAGGPDPFPHTVAGDIAYIMSATNPLSVLWAHLEGHPNDGIPGDPTLHGTGTGFGGGQAAGSGVGLLDAITGPAAAFLNSNKIIDGAGTFADLNFNSSFGNAVRPHPTECPANNDVQSCLAGSADLRGFLQQAPEPATLALMGLGILGFGGLSFRRKG